MSGRIPRSVIALLALALGSAALFTGCGQKGPLFLPEEAPQEQQKEQEQEKGEDKDGES